MEDSLTAPYRKNKVPYSKAARVVTYNELGVVAAQIKIIIDQINEIMAIINTFATSENQVTQTELLQAILAKLADPATGSYQKLAYRLQEQQYVTELEKQDNILEQLNT